jgi:vacuolar protein sorting-associated protein 13A/C
VKSSIPRYKLAPHSVTQYAWDQPAARGKKLMLMINDSRRVVDIMEIGVLVPFKFQVRPNGTMACFSPADQLT